MAEKAHLFRELTVTVGQKPYPVGVLAALPFILRISPCVCLPDGGGPEQSGPASHPLDNSHTSDHHGDSTRGGHDDGHNHDSGPCNCESGQPEVLLFTDIAATLQIKESAGTLGAEVARGPSLPRPFLELASPPSLQRVHPTIDPPLFLLNCSFLC